MGFGTETFQSPVKVSTHSVSDRNVVHGRRWPHSIRTLSGRVAELHSVYLPPDPASRAIYQAGEIAQCYFWFPAIRLPVGFGQVRTPSQLPVLTMITGYARWGSALLVPSGSAEDLKLGVLGSNPAPRLPRCRPDVRFSAPRSCGATPSDELEVQVTGDRTGGWLARTLLNVFAGGHIAVGPPLDGRFSRRPCR